MHHPAGFERFFEEMQQLVARQGSREERAALAVRFDMIPAPVSPGSLTPVRGWRGAPATR